MQALWASLLAGMATAAGALPVAAAVQLPETLQLLSLGIASGVMAWVSALALLAPALERGWGGALVALGLGAGGLALADGWMERWLGRSSSRELRSGWLLWLAVAVHNAPEGMAVGASYAAGAPAWAVQLAVALALHNLPEGLAIAVPLRRAGASGRAVVAAALGAGLVEPLSAAAAWAVGTVRPAWLPLAGAFAAGAMLYVVFGEMLPLIDGHPGRRWGIAGLAAGVALALALERVLHPSR